MSDSRLEKFIYAICSMDVSDLPVPLSRIEKLWNCLITGETPDFEPLSRNEKYLMAMLDRYDISNLPAPMSRGEKLLYKIAVGETDLSDVPGYLSRYEELLKYLIENGEISEDDFEYVLYTLNQSLYTLYTTAEKPVKSAILKGSTKYRDIDTGEVLDAFEDGRNLELVSVRMPVLSTFGDNLCDNNALKLNYNKTRLLTPLVRVKENTVLTISFSSKLQRNALRYYDSKRNRLNDISSSFPTTPINIPNGVSYIEAEFYRKDGSSLEFTDEIVKTSDIMFSLANNKVYEPHKSNILSVLEDVELRGVGEFHDELNLLTGELTENVVSFKMTGNEGGYMSLNGATPPGFIAFFTRNIPVSIEKSENKDSIILCDVLPSVYRNDFSSVTTNSIVKGNNYVGFVLQVGSVSEGVQWIRDNQPTVYCGALEKSIKTVDLTVVDQDNQPTELGTFENVTHVSLVAENLIPEVEMEVATYISEELASANPLMGDISTKQEQLNTTVDEQSENVDATMIATTEIFEEIL